MDWRSLERGMEAFERELRSMPRATWWERLYWRIFRLNTQSVVDRRMEYLARAEKAMRDAK